jgi:MFS family permease
MIATDGVRKLIARVTGAAALIVFLSLGAFSWFALSTFDRQLAPELAAKAATIGRMASDAVGRALSVGIPIDALVGAEEVLDDIRRPHPEILFVAVLDGSGRTLHRSGRPPEDAGAGYVTSTIPVLKGSALVGSVLVGTDPSYLRQRQLEIVYDIATSFVVSLVVGIEVVAIVLALLLSDRMERLRAWTARLAEGLPVAIRAVRESRDEIGRFVRLLSAELSAVAPGRRGAPGETGEAAESINAVRLPLLMFFFSHEMSRPFLPQLSSSLYAPLMDLPRDVAVALPFTIYLVAMVIFTPIGGRLAERFGTRRVFLAGIAPALLGYVGAAFATTLPELIASRVLNGVGYALISVAALGHITNLAGPASRARGVAVFAGASMVAAVSGSAIGGILAQRIGFGPTFFVSTALATVSAALTFSLLAPLPRGAAGAGGASPSSSLPRILGDLVRNPRFLAVTLLAALPMQVVTTGFLVFLAPLYLADLGLGTAAVGRTLMAYFVLVIFVQPHLARAADRRGAHGAFVSAGGLVAGVGMLAVAYDPGVWTMVLAVAVFGLGTALTAPMLVALLISATEGECARHGQANVIAVYRLVERGGGALGPVVAATLLSAYGFSDAIGAIGAGAVALGVVYAVAGAALSRKSNRLEQGA